MSFISAISLQPIPNWSGNSMKTKTNLSRAMLVLFLTSVFIPTLYAEDEPLQSKVDRWSFIRASLFINDRPIYSDDTISLVTPSRAENPAVVPISVTANIKQTADLYIKKIYLVVDENPSPVVGVFTISPDNGLASISTRIRVNAYSNVRAIAETSDGKLHMTANFVKASGGCSAPAGTNDEEAVKRRGKMKLRQKNNAGLAQMQLIISHPNYSGLQIDQLSRNWIPADYVSELKVSLDGTLLMSFMGGISMSENPSFQFTFQADREGDLTAKAKDSQGREYTQSWRLAI